MGGATTLTTGWEPGTPVEESFARRFVCAYADRLAAMADMAGGRVLDIAGARLVDLGSPFGYDNAVVLTRPPQDLNLVVQAAQEFFPRIR